MSFYPVVCKSVCPNENISRKIVDPVRGISNSRDASASKKNHCNFVCIRMRGIRSDLNKIHCNLFCIKMGGIRSDLKEKFHCKFPEKIAIYFPKKGRGRGGHRPFGNFPKINPFWRIKGSIPKTSYVNFFSSGQNKRNYTPLLLKV